MRTPCQTSPLSPASPSIIDPELVRERLALGTTQLDVSEAAQAQFAFKAPASFVGRIQPGDPDDPLLKQIWPSPDETVAANGFVTDPVGDHAAVTAPGLLQKYPGRALLLVTSACAIHCRYCFRRHFPYRDHMTHEATWTPALEAIAADRSLREVILSGGDPLTLSVRRLQQLMTSLAGIPHVERLRIHSRVPVASPERVSAALEELLVHHSQQTVLVIHANHPAELDESVHSLLWRLRSTGVTLLNQSVLLKGINDDAGILNALSERLFACGVLPYYLHQLDPVEGAAHFAVSDAKALNLIDTLTGQLPGYLVPKLVREIPGADSKLPLKG